jgi:hypothetical protein
MLEDPTNLPAGLTLADKLWAKGQEQLLQHFVVAEEVIRKDLLVEILIA